MVEENKEKFSTGEDSRATIPALHSGTLGGNTPSDGASFSGRAVPDDVRATFMRAGSEQMGLRFETSASGQGAGTFRFKPNISFDGKNPKVKISDVKFVDPLSGKEKNSLSSVAPGQPAEDDAPTSSSDASFDRSKSTMQNLYQTVSSEESEKAAVLNDKEKKASLASSAYIDPAPKLARSLSSQVDSKINAATPSDTTNETPAQSFARRMVKTSSVLMRTGALDPDNPGEAPLSNASNHQTTSPSSATSSTNRVADKTSNHPRASQASSGASHSLKINSASSAKPSRVERVHAANEELAREKNRSHHEKKVASANKGHIARLVGFITLAVVLILAIGGYFYVNSSLKAVNVNNSAKKSVNIPNNSSSKQVASILEQNHLIKNATIFQYYTRFKGINNFKSGYYSLSEDMTPDQIAEKIQTGAPSMASATGEISVADGATIAQIAKAVTKNASDSGTKTPITADSFLAVLKDPAFITEMRQKYPKLFAALPSADSGVKYQLEGYLAAGNYSYDKKTTARSLASQMVAGMNKELKPYYGQLDAKNLTVNDLLTLASMVEKEANTKTERAGVAEVFLNDLNRNIPLQSTSAYLYAEGKLAGADVPATVLNDTSLASAFNLFTNAGMTPGPIGSPTKAGIEAILNHARNDNIYFVSNPKTKKIYFAATEAEQNDNVAKYVTPNASKQ